MCGAIGTDGNAAVSAGNQDVEVAVADGGADLVEIAGGSKGGVRSEDRQLPFSRESSGGRRSGLFGDAHADPALLALGLAGIEIADGDRAGNVETETDHALIVSVDCQRLAEAFACGLHLYFHRVASIPPVVVREFRHAAFDLAVNFLLIVFCLVEQMRNGNAVE